MKDNIKSIIQIIANIICASLYFCKIFVGVGLLQDGNGNIVEKHFHHSPFENLSSLSLSPLMYISLALIASSVILSAISLIKEEDRKTAKVSFILSLVSVIFTAFLILLSSTVVRGY